MSDLAGDASRRVVANSQAKYLYWILGGAGGTPVVLTLFSNPQQRWAILGVAAVAGVLACRYLTPVSVRLGPDTMVVHWPLRSVMVDADSLRLAKQSPTVAGRDTISFSRPLDGTVQSRAQPVRGSTGDPRDDYPAHRDGIGVLWRPGAGGEQAQETGLSVARQ